MSVKRIDTHETEGIFVVVGEGKHQGPMVMETEGEHSSYDAASERARTTKWLTRTCVCRLVPVSGNELLALDMMRLQSRDDEEGMPF